MMPEVLQSLFRDEKQAARWVGVVFHPVCEVSIEVVTEHCSSESKEFVGINEERWRQSGGRCPIMKYIM